MQKRVAATKISQKEKALYKELSEVERHIELLKDGNAFREYVIKDDRTGKRIVQDVMHKTWIEHIAKCRAAGKHCAIMAHWGSGKSVQVAIGESLRMVGQNPSLRIKIISSSDLFAMDRLKTIKNYIDEDEDFKRVYPHVKPNKSQQWTQHRIYVERPGHAIDPTVEARGLTVKGVSGRADVLIFDDAVDEDSISSEAVRNTSRQKYQNVWMSRLVDDGFVIYIGTRWAEEDLSKTVMESGRYLTLIQRVSADFKFIEQQETDGKETRDLDPIPLCSFWQEPALRKRLGEINERAFERGFRQRAITEGERTFPHFEKCVRYGIPQSWERAYTGVDLSGAQRKGNIILTIGVDADGIKFPIDVRTGNWSSPETAEQIKEVHLKYNPLKINVENNAYQQAVIDWMTTKNYRDISISAFTTGKQKSDASLGLPALDVQFERGQWIFYMPDHDTGCRCPLCQLAREIKNHPGYGSTDMVMALWFAERASRAGSRSGFKEEKRSRITPPISAGYRNMEW